MLNISGISEGFVLDHIQAGMSLKIYHDLGLDKMCIRDRPLTDHRLLLLSHPRSLRFFPDIRYKFPATDSVHGSDVLIPRHSL